LKAIGAHSATTATTAAHSPKALGPLAGEVKTTANSPKALGPLAAAEQDILARSSLG